MINVFTDDAWDDYLSWESDKPTHRRINRLVEDIDRHPFEGIGKPEELKNNYSGLLSRRINKEHRIIYSVSGDQIIFYSLRDHYGGSRKSDAISKARKRM